MSIGEKIQHYRKAAGLSQEELGQKLFVSRQTVSQWESDKTVPTVDNLILLKKVLGVSVDTLLGDTYDDKNVPEPREHYAFSFDDVEIKRIYKQINRRSLIRMIVLSSLLIPAALLSVLNAKNQASIYVVVFTGFIIIISIIRNIILYKKRKPPFIKLFAGKTFVYNVYDTYFTQTVIQNDEDIKTNKIYFNQIENRIDTDDHILLIYLSDIFIIKKKELIEYSAFENITRRETTTSYPKKMTKKQNTISVLLFVLSIVSFFAAYIIFIVMFAKIHTPVQNAAFTFFAFLPVPISSAVYSIYLKKQGCRSVKNLIVGIIIAVLLLFSGLLWLFMQY